MNNNWHKKEKPLLGLTGLGGGVDGLAVVGAASKTYVDDVFSTYVYTGNATARSISNGIDLAAKGGLVWTKVMNDTYSHALMDSARGISKNIRSERDNAEVTYSGNGITSFNSDGYSIGDDQISGSLNYSSSKDYVSWTFRKAPGFFDVVTWTGNGSQRTISHSLGSVPGCIIVKNLSSAIDWAVWHKGAAELDATNTMPLNLAAAASTNNTYFDNGSTPPTADEFTVHTSNRVNASGEEYVAYVYAGGESQAATARSVAFASSGSNTGAQSLTIASSSDTDLGSGDFTLECWFKDTAGITEHDTIFSMSGYTSSSSDTAINVYVYDQGIKIFDRVSGGFSLRTALARTYTKNEWVHFALTRSGTHNTVWLNGSAVAEYTAGDAYSDGQDFYIGGNQYSGGGTPNEYGFNGKISNVRITKGEAVYTAPFNPSNEPLTTTTGGATASNVKVICCNNSSVTGSSLTSGTITSTSSPTASSQSPFDDPNGFVFGSDGDENIIKTGSYVGDGNNPGGPKIFLGWEPQYIIFKDTQGAEDWMLFDSIRGIVTGYDEQKQLINENLADVASTTFFDLTAYGFDVTTSNNAINKSGDTYIYIAIRRPDGHVGKPASVGTDVFFQNTLADADDPSIRSSTFAADMGMIKTTAIANSWNLGTRLTQGRGLVPDTSDAEVANSNWMFDYMNGANEYNNPSVAFMAYLWKRHAGFDVVTYTGDGETKTRRHNLAQVPEMVWIKRRDGSKNWGVYHKGLNGGTTPWNYYLKLNETATETSASNTLMSAEPTATRFFVSSVSQYSNYDTYTYIAFLFASVTGISKVGSYTGNGSATERTITLGFQPKFLIVKNTNDTNNWNVLDTTRGWAAGNDNVLYLDGDWAQGTGDDVGAPTSTGFTITSSAATWNASGNEYIYYAHA